MILVRAPLRISFMGGGTDIPAFYKQYPGRVISTTIDKYVYLTINHTPLVDSVTARYSKAETVQHPSELEHARIRELLLHLGIEKNIEIGSFASLPAKTGLGSSSSFSVALVKGLYAFLGKRISAEEAAAKACQLEISMLKEPIGKQDQYAASLGGLNVIQFNPDGSVEVEPLLLDFKRRSGFNQSMLLFYTGLTRNASDVLTDQTKNIDEKLATYKQLSDSVLVFRDLLLVGDLEAMGDMLHKGWQKKKSLSTKVSNSVIDKLYDAGIKSGAWGGKVLGAGGGGCILFMAPRNKHDAIRAAMQRAAGQAKLSDFREIPFLFIDSGTDVLYNALHPKTL